MPEHSRPRTCSAKSSAISNERRGRSYRVCAAAAYSLHMCPDASPAVGQNPDVRLSVPAVQTLRALGDSQKQSVAAAVRRIRPGAGKPLLMNNRSLGTEGGQYRVIVPDDNDTPVVIFRELGSSEQGDFLVTAITDRQVFNDYERAERQGMLNNKVLQAWVDVAVGNASAARSYGEAALEASSASEQGAS